MVHTLLSVLFLGLFPSMHSVSVDQEALSRLEIAPVRSMVDVRSRLSASGVVILDLQSGQRLFARESHVQRPMASLTKLMTALIIVENHDLDQEVKIPISVRDVTGNKAYLSPSHHYTLGELLSALLINSANDAALTLAQFHSGSVPAFVAEMNQRARTLGMKNTAFKNPAGLDHPAQWSTPEDIAWLSMYALQQPEISDRMGRSGQRIVSREGESISLYHTHALLHEVGPVMAGKTGTTNEAGQCLMSIVQDNDEMYLVVLMHSNQRYKDMQTILSALTPDPTPLAKSE